MTSVVEAQRRARALARTPEERLRMAARMFAGARVLAQASAASATESEIRRHLFRRFYGQDFPPIERDRILAYLTAPR
jgi:hypothetical protein